MKENAKPAMVAAAIALLALFIGYMGWMFVGPGSRNSGRNPYGNMTGKNGPPPSLIPQSGGGTAKGSPSHDGSPSHGPGSGG